MLINLARDTLAHAGWGEDLLVGRYTWKLGSGVRNVDEDANTLLAEAEGLKGSAFDSTKL